MLSMAYIVFETQHVFKLCIGERLVLQPCPTIRQTWEHTPQGQIHNQYTTASIVTVYD